MGTTYFKRFSRFVKNSLSDRVGVGVFTLCNNPSFEDIRAGFATSLSREVRKHSGRLVYHIPYFCKENKANLSSSLEEIAGRNYDVLLCVGTEAAEAMHEYRLAGRIKSPVVYADVHSSKLLNDITQKSLMEDESVCMINTHESYAVRVRHLIKLMPKMKRALIVYDPTAEDHEMDKSSDRAILAFSHYNVETTMASYSALTHDTESSQFRERYGGYDIIFTLHQARVMSSIERLGKAAISLRTPLIASDLASTRLGASIGCGQSDINIGIRSGLAAFRLVHLKQENGRELVRERIYLSYSPKYMYAQGLKLPPEGLEYLRFHEQIRLGDGY